MLANDDIHNINIYNRNYNTNAINKIYSPCLSEGRHLSSLFQDTKCCN